MPPDSQSVASTDIPPMMPKTRKSRPKVSMRVFFNNKTQGSRGSVAQEQPAPPTITLSVHVDGRNGTDMKRVMRRMCKKLGIPTKQAKRFVFFSPWFGIVIDDVRLLGALKAREKEDVVIVSAALCSEPTTNNPTLSSSGETPNKLPAGADASPITALPKRLARKGAEIKLIRQHSLLMQQSIAASQSPSTPSQPNDWQDDNSSMNSMEFTTASSGTPTPTSTASSMSDVNNFFSSQMPSPKTTTTTGSGLLEDGEAEQSGPMDTEKLLALCLKLQPHNVIQPDDSDDPEANESSVELDPESPDFDLQQFSQYMLDCKCKKPNAYAAKFDYSLFLTKSELEKVWRHCPQCQQNDISIDKAANGPQDDCRYHVGKYRFGLWTCCRKWGRSNPEDRCVHGKHNIQTGGIVVPISFDAELDFSMGFLDDNEFDNSRLDMTATQHGADTGGRYDRYDTDHGGELFVVDSNGLLELKKSVEGSSGKNLRRNSMQDQEDLLNSILQGKFDTLEGDDGEHNNDVEFLDVDDNLMHKKKKDRRRSSATFVSHMTAGADDTLKGELIRTDSGVEVTFVDDLAHLGTKLAKQSAFAQSPLLLRKDLRPKMRLSVSSKGKPKSQPMPQSPKRRYKSMDAHFPTRSEIQSTQSTSSSKSSGIRSVKSTVGESGGTWKQMKSSSPEKDNTQTKIGGRIGFENGHLIENAWRPDPIIDEDSGVELVFTTDGDAHYGEFGLFVQDLEGSGHVVDAHTRAEFDRSQQRSMYVKERIAAQNMIRSVLSQSPANHDVLQQPVDQWVFGTLGMYDDSFDSEFEELGPEE
eukprot:TRINITY_DN15501_c0_g1_i1.p1 TRINITY_DN15501_c0_g1~~TRINITY_DN15501_c0_g1_i1.p1  ORF type:complete len:859 (-),score=271.15 TRINITY_DN15501_c0_g1_i1:115-2544(-)